MDAEEISKFVKKQLRENGFKPLTGKTYEIEVGDIVWRIDISKNQRAEWVDIIIGAAAPSQGANFIGRTANDSPLTFGPAGFPPDTAALRQTWSDNFSALLHGREPLSDSYREQQLKTYVAEICDTLKKASTVQEVAKLVAREGSVPAIMPTFQELINRHAQE